jgi:hypothetical protein
MQDILGQDPSIPVRPGFDACCSKMLPAAAALIENRACLRHKVDQTRCQEAARRHRQLMAGTASSRPSPVAVFGEGIDRVMAVYDPDQSGFDTLPPFTPHP